MKKIISLLLCVCLMCVCLPVTASAAGISYSSSTSVYQGSTLKGTLTCTITRYADSSRGNEEFIVYAVWSGNPEKLVATVEVVNYLTGQYIEPKKQATMSSTTEHSVGIYPAIVEGRRYTTYGCAEVYGSNYSGLVRKTLVDDKPTN